MHRMLCLLPSLLLVAAAPACAQQKGALEQQFATELDRLWEPEAAADMYRSVAATAAILDRSIARDERDANAVAGVLVDAFVASVRDDAPESLGALLPLNLYAHGVRLHPSLSGVGEDEWARLLEPALNSDDAETAAAARAVATSLRVLVLDNNAWGERPRFEELDQYLDGRVDDPRTWPMVDLMFEAHPGAALRDVAGAYSTDANRIDVRRLVELDALLERSNPRGGEERAPAVDAALEELARHEAWPARLYAAHVMRRLHLARPDLLEVLKNDPNRLVREQATPNRSR